MNASKWVPKALYLTIPLALLFLFAPTGVHAQLIVDCTGANPYAFTSINAAVQSAPPQTLILVTGPCNENVFVNGQMGLDISAWYGQPVTINGSINIGNSQSVYLYGLNISNPYGNGVNISDTDHVWLDTCTSNGNAGVGLNVYGMSSVVFISTGALDNNNSGGMNVTASSNVEISAWGGPFDISNNRGPGIYASQANVSTLGNTTISNNTFGLDLRGGAHVQMGAISGPNSVSGNPSGGAWLQENAEISFWTIGPTNFIQGNGPVGVLAGLGSQVTFYNGAVITDHTSAGVDVYANSEAYFFGPTQNQVLRNGSASDPRSAGIRVDGNSQALLRGGEVQQNYGVGILALVNSSVDFTGVGFSGNKGVITCDSSSTMVSDLALPNSTPAAGVACRTPHSLGNRQISRSQPTAPDWSAHKAVHDRLVKAATKH